jgi:uncharacterized protein
MALLTSIRLVTAALTCWALLTAGPVCAQQSHSAATPDGGNFTLPAGVHPVAFGSGTVVIHSTAGRHALRVEIARTGPQVQRGLMYRTTLPERNGMLFIYPKPHHGSFWMLNTLIPLSISYADEHGIIFQITDMVPCGDISAAECSRQSYPAQRPFRYALEVNRGYFSRQGVRPGDRIELLTESQGVLPN